jgi:cyclic pyranopterin phosphate synthase
MWFLCLYAANAVSLRDLLRQGGSDTEVEDVIWRTWGGRTDRGAEQRAATADRQALYRIEPLRADPHKEMHTRGG